MSPSPSLHKIPLNSPSYFISSVVSLFILYSSASCPSFASKFHLPHFFLKFPVMPLTTTKAAVIKHHQFTNLQSLSDWLRPRLTSDSFAAWGTRPGTKNIHNLWLKLSEGETSLADPAPPVRTVEVVVVRVRDDKNRILIEYYQELSNSDVRSRSRPLSVKMKRGETAQEAVVQK